MHLGWIQVAVAEGCLSPCNVERMGEQGIPEKKSAGEAPELHMRWVGT